MGACLAYGGVAAYYFTIRVSRTERVPAHATRLQSETGRDTNVSHSVSSCAGLLEAACSVRTVGSTSPYAAP